MRYLLTKSKIPNHWVCTDIDNGIVCVFEHQNYSNNQTFTFLEDVNHPDAIELAKIVNQMGEWLRENHYSKILPCDIRLRIGRRIVELRTSRGYTQEDFAKLIGIEQSNLSRTEHGKHSTGLDVLGKIEEVLGCKFDLVE